MVLKLLSDYNYAVLNADYNMTKTYTHHSHGCISKPMWLMGELTLELNFPLTIIDRSPTFFIILQHDFRSIIKPYYCGDFSSPRQLL